MAKAGSWRTGFISAPLAGAMGKIVSKGFDVRRRKRRNPTIIIDIIPMLFTFKSCKLSVTKLNKAPQSTRNNIQRNIDPSWALQIDVIL
jgi:Mn2+/Fe2+ NRAMP family transporter